jgi:hypothetical protein
MDDSDILDWLGPPPPPPSWSGNPLATMNYLEQAFQFKVEIIPVAGTIAATLENLGFSCNVNWWKESDDGYLGAKSFAGDGRVFILIFNSTKLGAWRRKWKRSLRPGEPSYKRE